MTHWRGAGQGERESEMTDPTVQAEAHRLWYVAEGAGVQPAGL